jgi:hypothetical protein
MGPDLDRLMAHLPEAMPDGAVPLHAMWNEAADSITIYFGRDGELPRFHVGLRWRSADESGNSVDLLTREKREAEDFWQRLDGDPSLRGGGPRLWFVEIGGRTWLASSPGRNTLRFWGYTTFLDDGARIGVADTSGGEIARRVAEAVRG